MGANIQAGIQISDSLVSYIEISDRNDLMYVMSMLYKAYSEPSAVYNLITQGDVYILGKSVFSKDFKDFMNTAHPKDLYMKIALICNRNYRASYTMYESYSNNPDFSLKPWMSAINAVMDLKKYASVKNKVSFLYIRDAWFVVYVKNDKIETVLLKKIIENRETFMKVQEDVGFAGRYFDISVYLDTFKNQSSEKSVDIVFTDFLYSNGLRNYEISHAKNNYTGLTDYILYYRQEDKVNRKGIFRSPCIHLVLMKALEDYLD